MRHFVLLHLYDGRDVAWPVDDIIEIEEIEADVAAKAARTGCVNVLLTGADRAEQVIGTVASVLALVRDAQKETA